MPIVDWEVCSSNANMSGITLVESMLCAGGEGKATCKVGADFDSDLDILNLLRKFRSKS